MLRMTNDWNYYCDKFIIGSDYHLLQGTTDDSQKQIIAYCRKHSIHYDPIDDCIVVRCIGQQWNELIDWLDKKDIDCFI